MKRKEGQNYPQRWPGDEWARWECESLYRAQYAPLGDGRIRVSPAVVLFTQGCISSCFGSGRPIDDNIQHIQAEPYHASCIPEIEVFELDGRLYSINNRRLYVWRVCACIGVFDTITAGLLPRDDLTLQRQKYDAHRLRTTAPKWERHLSSQVSGLVVSVSHPGSAFEHQHARAPSCHWECRK